jgi:hypothetical protein
VILDEPRWASRYGGDSAAPVFAEVCRALANASSLFDEELVERVVEPKRARRASFATPNFLRMDRAAALEHARKIGCNVLCQGEQGRVVAQEPPPGVATDRDAVIRLHVSDNPGGKTRKLPDLRGMDMREAKIVAARYGYRARFTGTGIVKRQKRSGRGSQQTVQLYCEAAGTSGGSR